MYLLNYKRKIDQYQFKVLIAGIAALVPESKLVTSQKEFLICRDPADNMILECCFAVKANILITGDKDLLDIKKVTLQVEDYGTKRVFEGEAKGLNSQYTMIFLFTNNYI